MSQVRVHNFSISLDGFGTGDGFTFDAPFGHAGHRLHEWMFATRFWRTMVGRDRWQRGCRQRVRRTARVSASAPRSWAGASSAAADRPVDRCRHRRRVARLVGTEPAVPHAGVRAHPPPAPVDRDGGRHRVPLRRRQPAGGARPRPPGRRRPRRAHRRRPDDGARLPRRRPHRRRSTSCRCRSCSAAAFASGTAWKASRSATTSRRSRHRAASPT